MRLLLTGVSGFALACLAGGALAQDAAGQQPGAMEGGERAADEITCRDISVMQTALVPGVLYFVAGHREGIGAGAGAGGQAALQGEDAGAMAGMEDATVAQEAQLEDEEPAVGPAVAGTEDDPAIDETETLEAEADMDEAEVDLAEDENGETETAEDENGADELAVGEAATDETTPEMGLEPEIAEGEAGAGGAEIVRVRGHFEIPIEQTVIACAQDPDALLAEVIENQRGQAGIAGGAEEPEAEEVN